MFDSKKWNFSTFGISVNTNYNGYELVCDDNGDRLNLWSRNGCGKLVPKSNDGIAFYYTRISPTEAFKLSADIEVINWTFSNGQEGFGLIATDAVGENGFQGSFWNNSYSVAASKINYIYIKDKKSGYTPDARASASGQYSMRIGLLAQEKIGISSDIIKAGTMAENFRLHQIPLDFSVADSGLEPGNYNIIGNFTNDNINSVNPRTKFHFELERRINGYQMSIDGNSASFLSDKDSLTRIDKDFIYVGFFAARNAVISATNIEFNVSKIDSSGSIDIFEYAEPEINVEDLSGKISNKKNYSWITRSNYDGRIIYNNKQYDIKAYTPLSIDCILKQGDNTLSLGFSKLNSVRNESISHNITVKCTYKEDIEINSIKDNVKENIKEYQTSNDKITVKEKEKYIYVSNSLELIDAVENALPGNHIILKKGIYIIDKALSINSEISGEPDNRIYLEAENYNLDVPDCAFYSEKFYIQSANLRPVIDFNKSGNGIKLAASYWTISGIDFTNSADYETSFKLNGNHNIIKGIRIYRNGNTGLQISREAPWQPRELWPSDNRIEDCISFLNSDPGFTDSDGMACKITSGNGNKFINCISAYNADDGFDCFAKPETGSPGSAYFTGCIAYRNGYLVDYSGNEKHVGLGIGFKLGGSGIYCNDTAVDCFSLKNGLSGLSSNTSPDANAENVTILDSDGPNVDMCCYDKKDTRFNLHNIKSLRSVPDSGTMIKIKYNDVIRPYGSQNTDNIYNDTNVYFNEKSELLTKENTDSIIKNYFSKMNNNLWFK